MTEIILILPTLTKIKENLFNANIKSIVFTAYANISFDSSFSTNPAILFVLLS